MTDQSKPKPDANSAKPHPATRDAPAIRLGSEGPAASEAVPPTKVDPNAAGTVHSAGVQKLPTQFGRYRLIRELGRGGMGTVVLAEDKQLGRNVALKIPFLKQASDARTLKRFEREAKAAAGLSHPNLCAVYDFGTFDKWPYLSMTYIEGQPLQAFLDSGRPIPERTAAGIIRRVALGLQHAHGRGVIHRDLKPSNIMIEPNQGPIVTDFGLARCLDADGDVQLTQDGVAIGTPSYMSPEQLDGDSSQVGPQSDIFSLGLILFELLTGQRRFQGKITAIIGQILTRDPISLQEFREDVDPHLDIICRKMMARNPAERYESMAEVASAMRSYLKGDFRSPARPAVAAEMSSDPEVFFAELAAVEQAHGSAPSTQGNAAFDNTQNDILPSIVISDENSRSTHSLARQPHPTFSRLTVLIVVGLLGVIVGMGLIYAMLPRETPREPVGFTPPTTADDKPGENKPAGSSRDRGELPSPPPKPNVLASIDDPAEVLWDFEDLSDSPSLESSSSENTPKPVPVPDNSPKPTPQPVPPQAEPVYLTPAEGKIEFHALVEKTINGSTTEKKFKTPRLTLKEVATLERREREQDKSLEQVRIVIELNGNAFAFDEANAARDAVEALDDALRESIPVEDIFDRLSRLDPGLVEEKSSQLTNAELARLRQELRAVYDAKIKPYLNQLNNNRGPLSERDLDRAQAFFEREARKIAGFPKSLRLPTLHMQLFSPGSISPNAIRTFAGNSQRYLDQTPRGQIIKRAAEALRWGSLIDSAGID